MTPTARGLDLRVRRGLAGILSALFLVVAVDAAPVRAATYDPQQDVNSMASVTSYSGAQAWWSAGYTGAGVDVAIIDSGVSPVQGLNAPGKVVYGPDLSLESQASALTNFDTFGHGTFMAGLIAGHDDALVAPYALAPAAAYRGMAPDARIVSLKVATADGGTDVSQMIAAIDWVVQHRHDNGLNIRVLNLSYGTNSSQWYGVDPLAFAVEQAWEAGIVVVASAGNSGYQTKGSSPALADPAYDKRIIAVGASDSMGTATLVDDTMPDFSAAAKTGSARATDFVAPGVHIQGLRVLNSYIDANVDKTVLDDRFMRGSGTSESAAIASGAAALILSKFPQATPDQVKKMLKDSAYDLASQNSRQIGAGELHLGPALTASLPVYSQSIAPATGGGSLEQARGSDHLTRDGVVLKGEIDIFGNPFNSVQMAALEAARDLVVRRVVERQHLVRQQLVGLVLVRVLLVGQLVVRVLVVRQQLVRFLLVRQLVVGLVLVRVLLVRQLVVRVFVVRQQLVRLLVVHRHLELNRRPLVAVASFGRPRISSGLDGGVAQW